MLILRITFRIDLQRWYINYPVSIELDYALIRPSHLTIVVLAYFQTPHLNFIPALFMATQILEWPEVALKSKIILADVCNEALFDDFLNSVKGIYEFHATVIALYTFLSVPFPKGLT